MTFENLASIPYETIQLPALYGCKNSTGLCIWPPGRVSPQSPVENHLLKDENGYNWVLLSTDVNYPALLAHNTEDGTMIYCSSHYDGQKITCSTDDIETIHYLTRVEKSGKAHNNLSS